MRALFHSAILATSLLATGAIGIASAAIDDTADAPGAFKAGRLPIVASSGTAYETIETHTRDVSVLSRVPVGTANSLRIAAGRFRNWDRWRS